MDTQESLLEPYRASPALSSITQEADEMIQFEVYGVPAPQGSKKGFVVPSKDGGRPRAVIVDDNPKTLREWRSDVKAAAKECKPPMPWEGAVVLSLSFFMPVPKSYPKKWRFRHTKRPDFDKLTRAVCDALSGVIYRDDSQVFRSSIEKQYAYDRSPGLIVTVEHLPEKERMV